MELPRYRCHKVVHAAKITGQATRINPTETGALFAVPIESSDGIAQRVTVNFDFVHRNRIEPGSYFVRYEDGYESVSPAAAFEAGYTQEGGEPGTLEGRHALTIAALRQICEATQLAKGGEGTDAYLVANGCLEDLKLPFTPPVNYTDKERVRHLTKAADMVIEAASRLQRVTLDPVLAKAIDILDAAFQDVERSIALTPPAADASGTEG